MTRRFRAVAVVLAMVSVVPVIAAQTKPAPSGQAPAKLTGVMADLQGVWTMTSNNGQDMAGSGQVVVTTITGNKYEQTANGQVAERGTFKVDESKKPMTVDISPTEGQYAGMSELGVCQLSGKTLTCKIAQPGVAARPTDFAPADGFTTFVMVKK
ncbi:MAG TPA: TIGR03067 domain-containing protein [Vicinamibacterales bacterium]|nr:TIGR03067 domain-containing protein [Vicinamibacterales bacterium]